MSSENCELFLLCNMFKNQKKKKSVVCSGEDFCEIPEDRESGRLGANSSLFLFLIYVFVIFIFIFWFTTQNRNKNQKDAWPDILYVLDFI